MLADLAAGLDDRQRNTAGIARNGINDRQRITKAAAVGGVLFQTWMMSPSGSWDAPNGRSPTHGCGSSYIQVCAIYFEYVEMFFIAQVRYSDGVGLL